MKFKKVIAAFLSIVMVACTGCSAKKAIKPDNDIDVINETDFDDFCEEIFKLSYEENPFAAHYKIANPENYGITLSSDRTLGTFEVLEIDASYAQAEEYLKELEKFDRDTLTEKQQRTYDIFHWYLENEVAYKGTTLLQNWLGTSSGELANLSTNFVEYAFYSEQDVEDYLDYVESIPDSMDSFFDLLRKQSEKGYFPNDNVVEENIDICNAYFDSDSNPYIESFNDKIAKLNLDSDTESEYIAKNEEYVEKYVDTVYTKAIEVLEELKGTGKVEGGLANYGDLGIKLYTAIVQQKTSSDMTPEEAIDYCEENENEIISEVQWMVLMNPDVIDEFDDYTCSITDPDELLKKVISYMEEDFETPVTTNYNIEYQNKACELDGVLAYYMIPRFDDIYDNNIKVNSTAIEETPSMLYTTITHEGLPGHLYQYTMYYSNEEIPDLEKMLDFIGFYEGWAQYASYYSSKYLTYIDGIDSDLAELTALNERLSYLVESHVDLGVNYEGWDLEKVEEYLSQYGLSEAAEEMYDAVIGEPGGILSYSIGIEYMYDLQEQATDVIGEDGAKEFNKFVIETGIMPFTVFDDLFDEWLASYED